MARQQRLASMSIDALLKLRNDIGVILDRRADALKEELATLGADFAEGGRIAFYGKQSNGRKGKRGGGRKVAPKYLHPGTGRTWSGRGAPLKEIAEDLKSGKKLEDFLIEGSAKEKASRKRK